MASGSSGGHASRVAASVLEEVFLLRFLQNVVRPDSPEEIVVIMNHEGKAIGHENYALRSAIASSTKEKHLTRPAARSASASALALAQSKFRKYGGSVKAYRSSSKTAALVSAMFLFYLNLSTSSYSSSGRSSVILWLVFMGHLVTASCYQLPSRDSIKLCVILPFNHKAGD